MANVSKAASKFGAGVGLTGAPAFKRGDNIVDLIIADHNEAKDLYKRYKEANDIDEKVKLRNSLVKALVQHDECEQLLMYPLLREKVGGDVGEGHYSRSLSEHQELRELMYRVRYADVKSNPKQFDFKLDNAMHSVFLHVEQEEKEVLPLLTQHCSEEDLERVGASFKAHKPVTVTRPHPSAPTQGWPLAVTSLVMKPLDKIRDYWEGVA
ncbi:hypothetical protein V8B55DRAFT_1342573 [Mucor lusitanicus]|uniref:Hemerythrin-like domain-containing protein n=2 Tax=Mucor circinelloides f. lusitanicus TaxID=29924 RepID=A0A168N6Y1_MUCCL|nr:hypothetical protein FB192DRAFT_1286664 [Mucor lusitanicus]OAD05874.1 hypothetical protein MUCCIDRAFT_159576 [Mucor lusitanicus CBS 277.49]